MNLINLMIMTFITTSAIMPTNNHDDKKAFYPALTAYINTIKEDFSKISQDRVEELDKIAAFIQKQVKAGQLTELTYICTHNSRRSHFGQIWGATAAAYYIYPM